ncbi:chorismate mutase [Streptomyces sp. SolWspMP-sol7th]|nr:chorismate mutase [Streptomyces sp. SolWspMP-sol7th]
MALTLGAPQAHAAGSDPVVVPAGSAATAAALPLGPLAGLLVERLSAGNLVAASKFGTGAPIEDRVREEDLLDDVREKAGAYGLEPDATVAFFRDQIAASKVVQRGLFRYWTAHPERTPATRPDLSALRARLDRLTTRLLQELSATRLLRSLPGGCEAELLLATGAVSAPSGPRGLDALHRRALETASSSVCVTGGAAALPAPATGPGALAHDGD